MKKKYTPIICFAFISILVSSLSLDCSKKSCKPVLMPSSHEIIRDYEYLQRTFFDLGYADDFAFDDSIVEIKLYKNNIIISSNTTQNPAPFGIAYVNPNDTLATYPEGSFLRRFKEIEPNDYFVERRQYWIQFFHALEQYDILAVFYVVRHSNATFDTIGYLKDSCTNSEDDLCMKLKLIKPDASRPTDYTWDYEWKNVYYLMTRDIAKESFKLQIYSGPVNAEYIQADPNTQDGTSYLRILGLDQLDPTGNAHPDGIVDYRQIDFDLGYLFFPNRHPFAPNPNVSFTGNPGDTLKEGVSEIYNSNQVIEWIENSRYYIYVEFYDR